MIHTKYPRTPHLSFSPGRTLDDIEGISDHLQDKIVVVTEKLDGECTGIYKDGCHARSLDSSRHESRSYIKALQSEISNFIPVDMAIYGENMYAKHSIHYTQLMSYFCVFNILQKNNFLPWGDIEKICLKLGLWTVPVLYIGPYTNMTHDKCFTGESVCGGEQEGYVIRNIDSFPQEEFSKNVLKFVRPNHIQTDEHWLNQPLIKNRRIL